MINLNEQQKKLNSFRELFYLKKIIKEFSQSGTFNGLYNNFIKHKNPISYINLISILNFSFNKILCKHKILLLDSSNNIIYSNNKSNGFEDYIKNLNVFDIDNLHNYFDAVVDLDFIEFFDKSNINDSIINSFVNLLINPIINLPVAIILKSSITFVILTEQYVWKEQIKGYYYWQGNFVGSSPKVQYYFNQVSASQQSYQQPSNLVSTSSQFNYYGNNLPPNLNTIILFTGYSNAKDALNNLTNYTTGINMYTNAKNYFQSNGITNYLLSLCFGGGVNSTGGWDTGAGGAIYSIYEACTKKGVQFSYQETGTGNAMSGTGTGILDYSYNSLTFDIETWGYLGTSGSTGTDFINLFNYIKNNPNSNFYSWEMIIIVTVAHSCSNYNGTGQQVVSDLLMDSTGSYDFISPQLYTQNVGTTNEYCANYNILWANTGSNDNFVYYLSKNKNFIKYGLGMILPSVYNNNLLNTGGTNNSSPPNLYFYQSSSNDVNPPVGTASGWKQIEYQTDSGAESFFNNIFDYESIELGGSVQWINGDLL